MAPSPAHRVLWAAAAVSLLFAPRAWGHRDASDSVERTADLRVSPEGVDVLYHLHLHELAALPESRRLDADRDGRVSPEEREAYEQGLRERLLGALRLTVDDQKATFEVRTLRTSFPLGPLGLPQLELQATLHADWPDVSPAPPERRLRFEDTSYRDAPGHRSLRVSGKPRGSVRYRIEREEHNGQARATAVVVVYRLPSDR